MTKPPDWAIKRITFLRRNLDIDDSCAPQTADEATDIISSLEEQYLIAKATAMDESLLNTRTSPSRNPPDYLYDCRTVKCKNQTTVANSYCTTCTIDKQWRR